MRDILIDNIIHNFEEQWQVCEKMAASAQEQLEILQQAETGIPSQVMDIMAKRQTLLEDLQVLEAKNRGFQEQIVSELGINDFTLSQLEAKLENEQFAHLKEMVNQLGTMLKSISEIDDQSQVLMREGLTRVNKTKTRANNKQASNAYNQAKELK
ncbi:MAG: flagellar export chaperone FlgN [Syntrophomonadaceae bacterium]|nr:flagellar export chaperone FlgN [Syntrophomonadaceae bacterium]MDD3898982.1 flagellar export chaperone FlgN [Syntrophomonadaceae bacterium]